MPRKPARATGPRFVNHSYPSFYACYLLKSLAATPKGNAARTNYVGSTPNPPRRIRQHNGEITSGAWKTANRRPWVMQLIVHGFPSRMSALQFEWAFQNPWKARHLKQASFPKKGRFLKQNIAVARTMVASHPYNAMPLHIKLFTEEAKKYWDEASRSPKVPPLPPGLQVSVELEGVNGKSGNKGSGRQRPIDVTDTDFTTSHLRKNTNLLSSKIALECFFCREALLDYSSDPLSHVLCPSHDCTLVAHLHCMAEWFLHESGSPLLVPRGGRCPSCVSYVLWGDVVKGSYRRAGGGATVFEDEDTDLKASDPEEEEEATTSPLFTKKSRPNLPTPVHVTCESARSLTNGSVSKKRGRPPKQARRLFATPTTPPRKHSREYSSSGEEIFNFDEVDTATYSDDEALSPAIGKRQSSKNAIPHIRSHTDSLGKITVPVCVAGQRASSRRSFNGHNIVGESSTIDENPETEYLPSPNHHQDLDSMTRSMANVTLSSLLDSKDPGNCFGSRTPIVIDISD